MLHICGWNQIIQQNVYVVLLEGEKMYIETTIPLNKFIMELCFHCYFFTVSLHNEIMISLYKFFKDNFIVCLEGT